MGNALEESQPLPCMIQVDFQVPLQFTLAESWAGISFSPHGKWLHLWYTIISSGYDIGLGDVITDTDRSPLCWATG